MDKNKVGITLESGDTGPLSITVSVISKGWNFIGSPVASALTDIMQFIEEKTGCRIDLSLEQACLMLS